MYDWAEHFFAQIGDAVDLNQGRRYEMTACGVFSRNGFLVQHLAVRLALVNIALQFFLRHFVNHRTDVGGQVRRVTDHEAIHRAFEHGQQFVGNVFLYVQHAQRRAALPRALETAGDDVAHCLLWQGGGVNDHGVQATGFGNQQRTRRGVVGQGAMNALRRWHGAGEAHARHVGMRGQRCADASAVPLREDQCVLRHARFVHQLHRAFSDQWR